MGAIRAAVSNRAAPCEPRGATRLGGCPVLHETDQPTGFGTAHIQALSLACARAHTRRHARTSSSMVSLFQSGVMTTTCVPTPASSATEAGRPHLRLPEIFTTSPLSSSPRMSSEVRTVASPPRACTPTSSGIHRHSCATTCRRGGAGGGRVTSARMTSEQMGADAPSADRPHARLLVGQEWQVGRTAARTHAHASAHTAPAARVGAGTRHPPCTPRR